MKDFLSSDVFFAFWIFLPAGIANMMPPLANKILGLNRWKTPMDFGKKFRGKRIFGDNKTWRGFVVGTTLAAVTCALEVSLVSRSADLVTIILGLLAGALLGFGALLGDTIESFFKRQFGVKPGDRWFPFDQIDYIVGGLLLFDPFVRLPLRILGWIVIIYFGLHIIVSYLGYRLKFKTTAI